jgi:hypothetical protein
MRVGAVGLALTVALVVAGCGGSDDGGGTESARHLDPRSDAVVALDLDYESANWEQIKRLYARVIESGAVSDDELGGFVPPTLEGALGAASASAGLSFADDVKPLLGGTLYAGVRVEPAEPLSPQSRDILERLDDDATDFRRDEVRYFDREGRRLDNAAVDRALDEDASREPAVTATIVYEVGDADALDRVIEKLRGQGLRPQPIPGAEDAVSVTDGVAVVGGDTIVVVVAADGETSDRLLRERVAPGDAPEAPALDGDFVALRAAPTLLGLLLDRDELRQALETTAGAALRGAEARLRLSDDAARADARVDFEGLADDELPLPPAGAIDLPAGEAIVSGSANQNVTTAFLARLARELYPDSRFVGRVEALEEREGLRFEDEVLRQFAGPSFTVMRPRGFEEFDFGARSTLRDPAAMRELLPRIAPALPGILEALQGLGSTGLTSLLVVAPDAPLTPAAFGLLAAIRVSRLPGGATEELYEVTGLDERGFRPGPDRVVYGLIGDWFVVASSAELAREVAAMPTEPAPEAGTRLQVDVARLLEQAGDDEDARIAQALIAAAAASASAEDGDIVADAEITWSR